MKKALFVVSSTGGHLYPAISIISKFADKQADFYIIAPESLKSKIADSAFVNNSSVIYQPDVSLTKIPNILKNTLSSLKITNKVNTVVSLGSIFCVPVSISSKINRRKLIVMDQNVLPGRATRFLSIFADHVIVPFSESLRFLPFKSKTIVMLCPIRQEIQSLVCQDNNHDMLESILFFGGSLGSKTINQLSIEFIKNLDGTFKSVKVIAGKNLFSDYVNQIREMWGKNFELISDDKVVFSVNGCIVNVIKYSVSMADVYKDAKVIVSRAGGSSLSELLYLNKRAVVIPYPYAMDNHQLWNAKVVKEYVNFIDYLQEPIDYKEFFEKLERVLNVKPRFERQVRFFDYEFFWNLI
ncbi:MAG: UDP-N-acetylglucosamine--N-acetylmuramyl-(pentapeptide) pyrophosphoryl-undecaprenol N-acetylglucosamine transferase [bacterium]